MSFFGEIIKNSKLLFKRAKLKKEPEKVDIRLSSLPEWLYKITLEDPQKLTDKVEGYIKSLQDIAKEIEKGIHALKLNKILNMNISSYKKELVKSKKDVYITKLTGIKDGILALKDESIDEKRKELEKINKNVQDFIKKQDFLEKVLKEFFNNDIIKIKSDFSELAKELEDFGEMFKTENDDKVGSTIKLIEDIELAINTKEDMKQRIRFIESEIAKVKKNIYKLGEKLDVAKKTARFQDVLRERNDLAGYEQNKKRKLSLIKPKFEELFDLVENDSLVNEYKEHFEKAFVNDYDLEIMGRVDMLEEGTLKNWFKENLETVQKELNHLNLKIKQQLKGLKKFVIVNEVEDLEERTSYYQEKLHSERKTKRGIQAEIADLKLDDKKHKLYKDLMILTGYDVNIIYDEPTPTTSSRT